MTKEHIIQEVSRAAEITLRQSGVIVETIIRSIVKAVRRGERVSIRGFGSFSRYKRTKHTRRNPQTANTMTVRAKSIARFIPGRPLKDAVNNQQSPN